MDSRNHSDRPNQNEPGSSSDSDPLQNFVEGLSEKIGTEFGRIATHDRKREVKQEIARELGIEEEYVPWIHSSVNDDGGAFLARCKVSSRYDELMSQGKIVEVGEVAEQTKRFNEWVERLNAHLSGEECFHSEDHPHATWPPPEEPSGDPSEGVGCFPEIETDPCE